MQLSATRIAASTGYLIGWLLTAGVIGLALNAIAVPLPFIMGAVALVLIASKAGVTMTPPPYTVTVVQITLGITVGLLIRDLHHMPFASTIIGAAACGAMQFGIGYLWFKRRYSWTTSEAVLAAVPGAMSAVLALTDNAKAPPQKIVVAHCVRLIVLVCLAALMAGPKNTGQPVGVVSISNWVLLAAIALVALITGRLLERLHVAAPYMITALLAASAGQAVTTASLSFPVILDDFAMILLGLLIGTHLTSVPFRDFVRTAWAALGALIICLLLTGIIAYLWSIHSGLDIRLLMFSWVPGSVETMSFAALQAGLDTVFVMSSHVTRMLLIQIIPSVIVTYASYQSRRTARRSNDLSSNVAKTLNGPHQ